MLRSGDTVKIVNNLTEHCFEVRSGVKMKFTVELEQVDLDVAIDLMLSDKNVFYTYQTGKPLYVLDKASLPIAILNKAIFLTPCSFVDKL